MMLWEIRPEEGTHGVYLPDNELSKASHSRGINPAAMRNVFGRAGANEVLFQLVKPSADVVVSERQQVSDLVIWSWVPIFSDRAKSLAIYLGCRDQEFWPCRFESNPDEAFFLHLPVEAYDIVDVDKSTFVMTIPGDPPIPAFIRTLALKQLPTRLPPCFKADIPRHPQVFPELFVVEEFRRAWEKNGLIGARFRKLT